MQAELQSLSQQFREASQVKDPSPATQQQLGLMQQRLRVLSQHEPALRQMYAAQVAQVHGREQFLAAQLAADAAADSGEPRPHVPKRKSYNNLMTAADKQWLIKIQLKQLQTDNPYLDDFYYHVRSQGMRCVRRRAKTQGTHAP